MEKIHTARPTLLDIAADAGVSRATVSLVIRDVPAVSNATRKRVLRSIKKLGYPPEDLYAFGIRHFNQAIRTGAPPFATGEDGLRSLAIGSSFSNQARAVNGRRSFTPKRSTHVS